MSEIPDYIREQLNAQPPEDCCVQPDTLPAVAEGHLETASIATVGINPHGAASRASYRGDAEQTWEDKRRYFERRRYPYFGRLERVLKKCGASYGGKYDPKGDYSCCLACSIDVAQWATDPQWSKAPEDARDKLLKDGEPFFRQILEKNPKIELLLGNGSTVVRWLEQAFSVEFKSAGQIEDFHLVKGMIQGVTFIGWNYFLSRQGVTVLQMEALGKRVAELAGDICRP